MTRTYGLVCNNCGRKRKKKDVEWFNLDITVTKIKKTESLFGKHKQIDKDFCSQFCLIAYLLLNDITNWVSTAADKLYATKATKK